MKQMVMLETPRLRLEPLLRSHAPELYSLLSDARLFRFMPHDPPSTLEALTTRIEKLEKRQSPSGDEEWLNWVIRSKASGACMGRVEVTIYKDQSALLAYEVGVSYWGQGFATEACLRVLRSLFEDYRIHRVVAEIDTRNEASIRLVERLGFTRVSLKVGADFFKGSSSDEFTYVLDGGSR